MDLPRVDVSYGYLNFKCLDAILGHMFNLTMQNPVLTVQYSDHSLNPRKVFGWF